MAAHRKDPYATLGVSRDADADTIEEIAYFIRDLFGEAALDGHGDF